MGPGITVHEYIEAFKERKDFRPYTTSEKLLNMGMMVCDECGAINSHKKNQICSKCGNEIVMFKQN